MFIFIDDIHLPTGWCENNSSSKRMADADIIGERRRSTVKVGVFLPQNHHGLFEVVPRPLVVQWDVMTDCHLRKLETDYF